MKKIMLGIAILVLSIPSFANSSNLFAIQNGQMVSLTNNPMLHPTTYLLFQGIGYLPILQLGFMTGKPGAISATLFVGSFTEPGTGTYFGGGPAIWSFIMDATGGLFTNSNHHIRGKGEFEAFNGENLQSGKFRYRGPDERHDPLTSVPEPSTLVLLGTALLTLPVLHRFRQH
jgi:hypothetical protein